MKELPTIAEAGVPGFESSAWAGIVAPAGLPAEVAAKLTKTLKQIMESDEVRKQVLERGMLPIAGTGADFEKMVAVDRQKYGELIKKGQIKAQ